MPGEPDRDYDFGALLSDASAARYLDISVRQIWKLVAENELPQPIRVGTSRISRWQRADLDAAIQRWAGQRCCGASMKGRDHE